VDMAKNKIKNKKSLERRRKVKAMRMKNKPLKKINRKK
jgi:hypothetical protein